MEHSEQEARALLSHLSFSPIRTAHSPVSTEIVYITVRTLLMWPHCILISANILPDTTSQLSHGARGLISPLIASYWPRLCIFTIRGNSSRYQSSSTCDNFHVSLPWNRIELSKLVIRAGHCTPSRSCSLPNVHVALRTEPILTKAVSNSQAVEPLTR